MVKLVNNKINKEIIETHIFDKKELILLFISQLLSIGKVIEPKSDYQILIDKQKKITKKYFLNVILIPEKNFKKEKMVLEEYVEEKIYDYGFGITTGSEPLYSPSFNIKWEDIKDEDTFAKNIDDHKKVINIEKLIQMARKESKVDDPIVNQFITFLEDIDKVKELRKQIVQELFNKFIKGKNSKEKTPQKILFSFKKTNNSDEILYPGQIDGFRKWYVNLATAGFNKKDGFCHACNKIKEIAGPFNTGFFTLDQVSFSLGFTKKKSNQFQVCRECYFVLSNGFNFVEKNLNFYAYKIKKGKDDVPVYHYLIPMAKDPIILKDAIKELRRVKTQLNLDRKILTEKRIREISNAEKRAEKAQKKELKKKIANLEKEKMRYEDNSNISFDINELLEQLGSLKLSFLDIFYIVTDHKQNPTVKEIIDVFLIERERIQSLAKTIKEVKEDFSLNSLRFNDLNLLIGDRFFSKILGLFLGGGKISESQFEKLAVKGLKQAFKDEYFRSKSSYFSKKLETYQIMYTLFQKSDTINIGD